MEVMAETASPADEQWQAESCEGPVQRARFLPALPEAAEAGKGHETGHGFRLRFSLRIYRFRMV